jgi:hypothetical protein
LYQLVSGVLHRRLRDEAGGSPASPTHCVLELKKPRNVRMPSWAFLRSVQLGSSRPQWSWHIEPVRSRTSMRSSGFTPQGEHAVDFTLRLNLSIPRTPAKSVSICARSVTTTAFTGSHPGICVRHRVLTSTCTSRTFSRAFFPPASPLYS